MSFRIDALCLCLLTAAIPGTASALDRMERLVLEELACTDLPQSLIILSQLRDEGRIDTAQNLGYDSLSCFQIAGGLAVQGITFTSVCAYEEDAALQAAHPEFYYRGPGTSPGQTLSFGTLTDPDALSDWYLALFGPELVASAISDGQTPGEAGSVSCNSWMH